MITIKDDEVVSGGLVIGEIDRVTHATLRVVPNDYAFHMGATTLREIADHLDEINGLSV